MSIHTRSNKFIAIIIGVTITLALLVAIFKARPSPFYVMDEVEAALDDRNLGRLLTIFEQLKES